MQVTRPQTYIYLQIFFSLHSLTQYQTRSSKDYAEQGEAGNFLRDNVAEKLKLIKKMHTM